MLRMDRPPAATPPDGASSRGRALIRLYRKFKRIILIFIVFIVLLQVSVFLYESLMARYPRGGGPSCPNQLKQINLAMRMYADESQSSLYPPLHPEPGRLMWFDAVVPNYMPHEFVLFCPSQFDHDVIGEHRIERDQRMEAGGADNIMVDDWSYFYLGYALLCDDDVEDFAKFYKERVAAGEPVDGDIPLMRDGKPVTRSVSSEEMSSFFASKEYDRLFRLREGIEKDLLPEPDLRASAVLQSHIPLMIERPGNHSGMSGPPQQVCNVLFLDGHVEIMKYPGEWPMTEKTIGLLMELDALGEE